jgi:hypothetical protein
MHLSTHEFVALDIDWELTEFLETEFGNDFGAHEEIIHLKQTPSASTVSVPGFVVETTPLFPLRARGVDWKIERSSPGGTNLRLPHFLPPHFFD